MRVVVVGAGILGSSAAYHLSRQGADVEIIDQIHEGKATLAGAGIVCPWATKTDDPDFYNFYAAGGNYYSELVAGLAERGETEFGYRKVGALIMSEDPDELARAEARITSRAATAPEAGTISRLTPAEAKALFPPLREDLPAIHVSGGARVEARALSAAMLRVATANGVTHTKGHAELALEGNRLVVSVDGRRIEADQVIVAGGAWAPQILDKVGVSIPVKPQKGQIIHLGLDGIETKYWPVLLPITSHYMLAFDDSRVVIGATRETDSGFDYRVTAGGEAEVLNFGLKWAPGLANARKLETRIGFRPATDGIKPMLGRVSGIDNLVIGNGLGAGGLTMGPLAGRLVAEMALGQPSRFDAANYAIPA